MSRTIVRLLALCLALTTLPALAGEGRTPIPFMPGQPPVVITSPGKYILTRPISGTGGPVIDIATPGPGGHVDLDLNGMVVDNFVDPTAPVIIVTTPDMSVKIHNGMLEGGSSGIEVVPAPVPRRIVVEDVRISGASGDAIVMFDADNVVVRRCVIVDAGGIGIHLLFPSTQATIVDNVIRRTAGGIFTLSVMGLEISHNRIREVFPGPVGGSFGIQVVDSSSCLIAKNTVFEVFGTLAPGLGDGIHLEDSSGCKIYNNTVDTVEGSGITLLGASEGNLVLDNVVNEIGSDGIFVAGAGNTIERNTITFAGFAGFGYGLHFAPFAFENKFGRNSAFGSIGGPCLFPFSPELCDDAGPPGFGPNFTFGDNLVPGAFGLF